MEAITKLVAFIENPETSIGEREVALSELNLLGKPNNQIEEEAYNYWLDYFAKNIVQILSQRIVVISHLLEDNVFKECFDSSLQEYNQKRAQMGPDSLQKFGFTGF
jgi:hypothetical protein